MKTKSAIRKEIKEKLKKQNKVERKKKSLLIKERIFKLSEFKEAKTIMFYVSCSFEVDTSDMIDDALRMGKRIAVPYVYKGERRMIPSLVKNRAKDLTEGPYGIYQPVEEKLAPIPASGLDLVIVPGIAFTKSGKRIGRGAGYYDRFLKGLPEETPTIGIAFDLQVTENLPSSEQDVPVKKLITN